MRMKVWILLTPLRVKWISKKLVLGDKEAMFSCLANLTNVTRPLSATGWLLEWNFKHTSAICAVLKRRRAPHGLYLSVSILHILISITDPVRFNFQFSLYYFTPIDFTIYFYSTFTILTNLTM